MSLNLGHINLKNRNTLITGASGHLGKLICNTMAELGSNLIMIDKSGIELDSIAKDLQCKWKIEVQTYSCDLELDLDRKRMIDVILKNNDELYCLINNAAFVGTSEITGWNEQFDKQSTTTFDRSLHLNLTSVFELSQSLSIIMGKFKGSNIINIGSIYGFLAPDLNLYKNTLINNPAGYSVSKAALIHFTKWLAVILAPKIRVNAISPGGIFRNQDPIFVQKYIDKTPLGRMAIEDDITGALIYLSTCLSNYVTGHNLVIDGGYCLA